MNKQKQQIHYCHACDCLNTGECGGSENNKKEICDFYRPLGTPPQNLTFIELLRNKNKITYDQNKKMYVYI